MSTKPIEILLVEDSPDDIDITKEALEESKIHNNLSIVTDGEMALNFLKKEGTYNNAVTPDLILLDLNLPKMDGREVLKWIKYTDVIKRIPVIILTTSDSDIDKLNTYDLYANCYVTKPLGFEGFVKVVKEIKNFWFSIVKLPPQND